MKMSQTCGCDVDYEGQRCVGHSAPPGVAVSGEVAARSEGAQLCALGHHAYTPWTPPHETSGVSLTWCARGCGFYQRSDHGQ